jgi:hypothetical protein
MTNTDHPPLYCEFHIGASVSALGYGTLCGRPAVLVRSLLREAPYGLCAECAILDARILEIDPSLDLVSSGIDRMLGS